MSARADLAAFLEERRRDRLVGWRWIGGGCVLLALIAALI